MTVLLTDAPYKNSLAILRALATKDLEVYCSGTRKASLAFYSKYCKKHFIYSSPTQKPDIFKQEIRAIVKKENIDVLMPVGISPFTLISQDKERLEKYTRVPVADYNIFQKVHDKGFINEFAVKNNIPAPLSYVPKSEKELKSALQEFTYPLVIKARKGSSTNQVQYAMNQNQAIKIWKNFEKEGKNDKTGIIDRSFPLVQEYLPGEIIDIVFIFNNGVPKAVVSQKRVLTLPVNGGSGSWNITINEPEIARDALRLMKLLKWHGVGMVEFKRDANGKAKIIEVNPKFWGTSECSFSAGVNFPYMLYKIAMDGDVKPNYTFLYPKPFGWPFPMGIKTILESPEPISKVKMFLKLMAYKDSTDIRLLSDPKPFAYQLYQTQVTILKALYDSLKKKMTRK